MNDVPRIHTKPEELTNDTHCIVANKVDNGIDLKIPLKLDGIFSYFETRRLSDEEINDCDRIETLQLCPDASEWYP